MKKKNTNKVIENFLNYPKWIRCPNKPYVIAIKKIQKAFSFDLREYDNKIDKIEVNSLYKSLNKPTNRQLELVLDYAKKFAEYNQKTSETVICESKFNDFELFES